MSTRHVERTASLQRHEYPDSRAQYDTVWAETELMAGDGIMSRRVASREDQGWIQ